jgi:hypothetical protein
MLFLLRKNEVPSMFVRTIGMKIKLMQNFAVFVSLSSFYIISSSSFSSYTTIFFHVRLDTRKIVFLGMYMRSRKFLLAWASLDTAPTKLVKPVRHTSIGLSVDSSQ